MVASPCGQKVATIAGDEQLRIWDCFESSKKTKSVKTSQVSSITATNIRWTFQYPYIYNNQEIMDHFDSPKE